MSKETKEEIIKKINAIIERINNLINIEELLQKAIYIQLLFDISYSIKKAAGFNILISFDNINIFFKYKKGIAEIKAYYDNYEITKKVDTQKAQKILDYINKKIQ
jgi:hypothetical protein